MKRQFLYFYAAMIVVLLMAALIFIYVVYEEFESAVDKKTEMFIEPLLTVIRERIGDSVGGTEEMDKALVSINELSPVVVHLANEYKRQLSMDEIARIEKGDVVVVRHSGFRSVYALVAGGDVIHVGPIPFEISAKPTYMLIVSPMIILLFLGVILYALIRPVERRIVALSEAARQFGTGKLHSRAPEGGGGSLDELSENFNWMADKIEELIDGQRELLRAVSHDLRTPLARLFFSMDDAKSATKCDEKDKHLVRMDKFLTDINDHVEELMSYLRLDDSSFTPKMSYLKIEPIIRKAKELIIDFRPELNLDIELKTDKILADPRYLQRAVINVITNAARHGKKRIRIKTEKDEKYFKIRVDDDGPGIPEDMREKIFNPFYRLDRSRSTDLGGAGLGLAIVRKIMISHNGRVDVKENQMGGATFILMFPVDPA